MPQSVQDRLLCLYSIDSIDSRCLSKAETKELENLSALKSQTLVCRFRCRGKNPWLPAASGRKMLLLRWFAEGSFVGVFQVSCSSGSGFARKTRPNRCVEVKGIWTFLLKSHLPTKQINQNVERHCSSLESCGRDCMLHTAKFRTVCEANLRQSSFCGSVVSTPTQSMAVRGSRRPDRATTLQSVTNYHKEAGCITEGTILSNIFIAWIRSHSVAN